jgi:glycosyltransferase involved in cell wall biosynthesis
MNIDPKISVITVVRNGEAHIEDTIRSVARQTYRNIEYIIIDGKSTDSTLDIIRKHEKNIDQWISEPDGGIYDAMNKGVRMSTGDWTLFINADDYLASDDTIEKAVAYLRGSVSQVVYGHVVFVYPSGSELKQGVAWDRIAYEFRNISMRLPHQGTFHGKKLFDHGLFDTNFRILGDYDLLLRYLKNNDPVFIPVTIAKMRAGGISDTASKVKLLKEARKAQLKNGIYRTLPSVNWIAYAFKLVTVDLIIKSVGINGKDRFKRLIGKA